MFWLRLLIVSAFCSSGWAMAAAQESETALPEIWKEIERKAESLAKERAQRNPNYRRLAWETAAEIGQHHDRYTIDSIFRSADEVLAKLSQRENTFWVMMDLAAYVIIEIAEREGRYGLKSITAKEGARNWRILAIVGMDCYHDSASQSWLLDLALDDNQTEMGVGEFTVPGVSYFALQLLRGYEPSEAMRTRLERALQAEPAVIGQPRPSRITRADAMRSVLSSWDYAASLEDPTDRERYRSFQSRLWRFWAVSRKGFRGKNMEFENVARELLGFDPWGGLQFQKSGINQPTESKWQPGDERFVLHIFEEPASTPDEIKIAVNLAHRITDIEKLKAVADGDSPQAPYAREALQRIAANR